MGFAGIEGKSQRIGRLEKWVIANRPCGKISVGLVHCKKETAATREEIEVSNLRAAGLAAATMLVSGAGMVFAICSWIANPAAAMVAFLFLCFFFFMLGLFLLQDVNLDRKLEVWNLERCAACLSKWYLFKVKAVFALAVAVEAAAMVGITVG